jgi:dihydroorotase
VPKKEFIIRAPFDAHLHLREGEMLHTVLPWTRGVFTHGIIMPNLDPPIENAAQAIAYQEKILSLAPEFQPHMTIYLRSYTSPDTIYEAKQAGVVAAKYYPRGATTNSAHGIRMEDIKGLASTFRAMREVGMVLCLHMEDPDAPYSLREKRGLIIYERIREVAPDLKIVIEHISEPATFLRNVDDPNTAFTVTPHHLFLTWEDVIGNHHAFCMPIPKGPEERLELMEIVSGGHPRVFAGTDSAPHPVEDKNRATNPKPGIFSAPAAIDTYTNLFVQAGREDELEGFLSLRGPAFYALPLPSRSLRIYHEHTTMPLIINDMVVPFRAGHHLEWLAELL